MKIKINRGRSRWFNNLVPVVLVAAGLSGCGITLATVAGVTAYGAYASGNNGSELASELSEEIPASNIVIALQNKNMLVAGQVPEATDLTKVKGIIAKQYDDYSVYSYLIVGVAESASEQFRDKEIEQKVTTLLNEDQELAKNIAMVTSARQVYLLAAPKLNSSKLKYFAERVVSSASPEQVVVVQPKSAN